MLPSGSSGGDGRPSHVRDDRGDQPFDDTRPLAETAFQAVHARLSRPVEQHLHPHTDPHHGSAAGESEVDQARTADRAQPAHTGVEVADTGDEKTIGLLNQATVGAQLDLRANPLKHPNR